MKSNRLWTACIHLTLVLVIAVEIGWIIFAVIFLVPKFQKLWEDGIIDPVIAAENGMTWMLTFLDVVHDVVWRHPAWPIVGAVVLIGIFEWRVKSENKSLLRLSILGIVAVALTVISSLVGVSLAHPHLLSAPMTGVMARTFALVQVERIDSAIPELEQALANKQWDAMKAPAGRAAGAVYGLAKVRPALRAIWSRNSLSVEELRAHVKDAGDATTELQQAITGADSQGVDVSLEKLRRSFAPIRTAAKEAAP